MQKHIFGDPHVPRRLCCSLVYKLACLSKSSDFRIIDTSIPIYILPYILLHHLLDSSEILSLASTLIMLSLKYILTLLGCCVVSTSASNATEISQPIDITFANKILE